MEFVVAGRIEREKKEKMEMITERYGMNKRLYGKIRCIFKTNLNRIGNNTHTPMTVNDGSHLTLEL